MDRRADDRCARNRGTAPRTRRQQRRRPVTWARITRLVALSQGAAELPVSLGRHSRLMVARPLHGSVWARLVFARRGAAAGWGRANRWAGCRPGVNGQWLATRGSPSSRRLLRVRPVGSSIRIGSTLPFPFGLGPPQGQGLVVLCQMVEGMRSNSPRAFRPHRPASGLLSLSHYSGSQRRARRSDRPCAITPLDEGNETVYDGCV